MTIKDIAQLAGVSISTVSKIMNQKDSSISAETRERVLTIVKEFNYTPYSNSVGSRTKTFTIGLLLRSAGPNLLVNGIIKAAGELGYTVLIFESRKLLDQEFKGVTALCRHGVDGVLWEPIGTESVSLGEGFKASGIPFFLINSYETEGAMNLNFDQMGYEASMALIRARHKDIACLLSPGTRTEGFLNGYKRALFDTGISYREQLIFTEIDDGLLHKVSGQAVTGIVCSHFSDSNRLYRDLAALHYRIPQNVSLVSLRNEARDRTVYPEVSSITIPHDQFGRHLARELVALIENPDHIVLPFEFCPQLDTTSTIDMPITMRAMPMVVVGSINIDTYLKMDQLPSSGKSTITSNSAVYPGGKGMNQAIGAAKLGADVALIGAVGSDVDSDLIYNALKEHSIDSAGVRRCGDSATGKAYIFVQRDGESMISVLSGANNSLMPEDVAQNTRFFEGCRYCLVDTEVPLKTVLAACRTARAHGAKTILKPAACGTLPDEILMNVDILIPNLDELTAIGPYGSLREKAGYFLKKGVKTVIVTLGPDGSYVRTPDWEEMVPAAKFQSIDNTGAGDAFMSALAVYLQDGYPLKKAVRIATYAAGFSITREGVPGSLVDRGTLESYLLQQAPEVLMKE